MDVPPILLPSSPHPPSLVPRRPSLVSPPPPPHLQVDAWSENICEGCLKRLSGMKKDFKYLVTCTIGQKCGGGMHLSRASVMDAEKDLVIKVDYDTSPTIQCMVQVYCVAI